MQFLFDAPFVDNLNRYGGCTNFCFAKSYHESNAVGVVSQGAGGAEQPPGRLFDFLLRKSFRPQAAKFLYGGELAKRFADLEQTLRL